MACAEIKLFKKRYVEGLELREGDRFIEVVFAKAFKAQLKNRFQILVEELLTFKGVESEFIFYTPVIILFCRLCKLMVFIREGARVTFIGFKTKIFKICLLYTSDAADE